MSVNPGNAGQMYLPYVGKKITKLLALKSCCEEKPQEHCGNCENFPCALLNQFAYDEKQGDNGKRIEQCKVWKG